MPVAIEVETDQLLHSTYQLGNTLASNVRWSYLVKFKYWF